MATVKAWMTFLSSTGHLARLHMESSGLDENSGKPDVHSPPHPVNSGPQRSSINKALDTPCSPTKQTVLSPFNSAVNNLTIPALGRMRQEDHKCEVPLKQRKKREEGWKSKVNRNQTLPNWGAAEGHSVNWSLQTPNIAAFPSSLSLCLSGCSFSCCPLLIKTILCFWSPTQNPVISPVLLIPVLYGVLLLPVLGSQ